VGDEMAISGKTWVEMSLSERTEYLTDAFWKDTFREAEVKRIDRVAMLTAAAAVAVVIGLVFGVFVLIQLSKTPF
jgi:hypothetical protein